MSRILGVIPARLGSSRFPGKVLAKLCGRPMIEHVYRGTVASARLDAVVIATCDTEIARAAAAFGATTIMTSKAHERATDRIAEVSARDDAGIVVMVQGDEPMVRPEMIDAAVTPLLDDPSLPCVNLAGSIATAEELRDPNTVKVVTATSGLALYFSRAPIPPPGPAAFVPGLWLKQVCVIAFRRHWLQRFAALPQGPLERMESIDMLRLLEYGIAVRVVSTDVPTHAVDTPADLALVDSLMAARRLSRDDDAAR